MIEMKNCLPFGCFDLTGGNVGLVRRKILVTDATFQCAVERPAQFA
jgi:hypothetical protein